MKHTGVTVNYFSHLNLQPFTKRGCISPGYVTVQHKITSNSIEKIVSYCLYKYCW